ncbi:DUF732 domain-containing protein [Mycobacterium paraseoulense]|uniref:DUF732 domain-containing protein n=1 Tax=Mycobacterium paraseoulense TaxID=590652 RepID=A0A1X0IBP4_9MYCO|nr:DUF732 domain-containing protein [Mycobacterium paraseoulense]MCV7394597.1 DUF732 domain-containing protein [Mycobacterium paraseoulense]ORB42198.1 hypothetical protein BST39_10205 [Mycobacterium paraseoulense]BBZ73526.1 hypothetical protein MPRS_46190 [Mycobacterium paraseoulense]
MSSSTTHRAGALITAFLVLTGVVMLPHGAAAADPNPDDQFVALLDQKGIPALENVPSLIATAHRICRQLDGGMPVDGVVADMRERAFNANGPAGQYPPDRVARTIARFISAAVEAYCPNNQPKIASLEAMGYQGSASNTHAAARTTSDLLQPESAAHVILVGETGQPDPPQLPPPPPPTAQIMMPPPPVATPSPRQQPPPPVQEPLPGTQQGPPAAPAPGTSPGSGGVTPEPPPMPPGRVRLAP